MKMVLTLTNQTKSQGLKVKKERKVQTLNHLNQLILILMEMKTMIAIKMIKNQRTTLLKSKISKNKTKILKTPKMNI